MAYDIGPRIGIEGEKEFRAAITQVNTQLRTLGTEMAAVVSAYDKGDRSVSALAAQNAVLTKQITAQREKLDRLKEGLAQSTEKYGENDTVTQRWKQAVNKATADLNNMERQLGENTAAMDEASSAAKDVDGAVDDAGESAEKSGNRFEKLGKVLKTVGIAMGTAAVAAGAAAVALGKEVVKQFGELEQNLGGSEAVFGQYAANIQKTGEQAYKNLGVSQSDYLATANKMGALFQGSGIEQQKSLELTEKAMQRAADMASVMGVDMQMAMDSVAGAAKGNFTMMDNLGVAMNATTIEAYAAGKGLDFVWSKASQAEKSEMAMQMFFETTEQYAGNFARESTETITGALGMMRAATGSFVAGLGNADADMQSLTQGIIDAFQAVVANVVPVLENIVTALPQAVGALLPAIGALLPMLITSATDLFSQVLDTLLGLLPDLIPVAVDAVLTIVGALVDNLPKLIDAALQLMIALSNGIADALPELIPAVIEAVLTITETLLDNLPKLIEAALRIVMALAQGLIAALPRLIQRLPEIINKIVRFFVDNLPLLIEMGIKLTIELAKGLVMAIPDLVRALPQIISAVISGLGELLSPVLDIGKNIVKGLWNGINSMVKWVTDKVKGFARTITNGIKSFLGIRSPSRVFAGIGGNMGEGLGVGFTDAMKGVRRDMERAIPTSFSAPGMKIAAGAASIAQPLASASAPTVLQMIVDGRTLGEVQLPYISRGLATQQARLAVARG